MDSAPIDTVVDKIADDGVVRPFAIIRARFAHIEHDLLALIPDLIAALIFLTAVLLCTRLAVRLVHSAAVRRGRPDLGNILAVVLRWFIYSVALIIAAAMVFPGLNAATVFSTLSFASLAIGFAFKDILQNLLSGILILIQRPYRIGDMIRVKEFEGFVEAIESRVTTIKTLDGRKLLIPNSDVYTAPVTVYSAYDTRRDDFSFYAYYDRAPQEAADALSAALRDVEGVAAEPELVVAVSALTAESMQLTARWWAKSVGLERAATRARVIDAVYRAAADAGIRLFTPV